jgi:hypothetical protein
VISNEAFVWFAILVAIGVAAWVGHQFGKHSHQCIVCRELGAECGQMCGPCESAWQEVGVIDMDSVEIEVNGVVWVRKHQAEQRDPNQTTLPWD